MGRSNTLPDDFTGEVTVRAVPLDSGGYDPGGAYWGTGRGAGGTLYCVEDSEGRARYARMAAPIGRAIAVSSVDADDFADVLQGYIEAALFSSTTDAGDPLDRDYSETDIAPDTLAQMKADCETFVESARSSLMGEVDFGNVGRDFWFTRNGHGCGFGDGGYSPQVAASLTKISREQFSQADLYVGDDGRIYS